MRRVLVAAGLLASIVGADLAVVRQRRANGVADARAGGADCFGRDSIVRVEPGRIGALPLDLSLAELRRRCSSFSWTTTSGDESLDTAVLLTRPGLRAVGVVATVADEGGDRRPVRIDSRARVLVWKVSGTRGVLPNGVPLTATWNDLRRVYGPLGAFALNGTVYVAVCGHPGIGLEMELPRPDAPLNPVDGEPQNPATVDSIMARTPISVVELGPSPAARSASRC